jgi:hypothetical protein
MLSPLLPSVFALGFALSAILFAYVVWKLGHHLIQRYRDNVLSSTSLKLSDMFIFLDTAILIKISATATFIVPLLLLIITGNLLLAIGGAAFACFTIIFP